MKRFGVYISTLILLVSMTGGFLAPQHLFAVASDVFTDQTGNTYDYFFTKGNDLFVATLNSLDKVRTSQSQSQSGTQQTKILAQIDQNIALITAMKDAYNQSFSDKKATLTPVKTQIAAIEAAMAKNNTIISTQPFLSSGAAREPTSNPLVQTFLAGFINSTSNSSLYSEARGIDNGTIQPGSVGATTMGTTNAVTTAGTSISRTVDTNNQKECSIFGKSSIKDCLDIGFTWLIKNTLLQIGGFLVWLAANMFNHAIRIGILEFSTWAPDSLYPIWIIVRQIISLIVVFVGLYLGFMYILGKGEQFARYVPWIIAFALFVNFSYPLARTVIDLSNIVSLKIYTSAVGSGVLDPSSADSAGSLIMSKLGLQSLALSAVSTRGGGDIIGNITSIPGALLAVCFVFYTAYILFMVTGIMVIRTAVLVFLTIASPLLLVDAVLPVLGEKAKLLRKVFLEQLMVAPIFMIMLALTLKFLDVFSGASGPMAQTGGSGLVNNGSASVATFFNLTMMLVMLWIMIKVTKSTAGAVGEWGSNAMGKVGGFGLGVATGGAGFLARKGLGGLAMKARDSKWVQNNQDSFMGKRAYNLSNSVANSTFDLRNSTAVAGGMNKAGFGKGLLGMGGMGTGTGAKLGYEGEAKKKVEEIQARSARIKTKHERDMYETDTDGNKVLVSRKGDVDPIGIKAKERFHAEHGGVMFLSKKQKEDINASYVDESSAKELEEYKKKDGKEAKAAFSESLKNELDALTKSGKGNSPKAQAIARSIFDIKKEEGEREKAFIKQVLSTIDKYSATSQEKQKDFLARLDKDVREAVLSGTTGPQRPSSQTNQTSQAQQATKPAQTGTGAPIIAVNTPQNNEPQVSIILDQNGIPFKPLEPQTKSATNGIVSDATPGVFDIKKVDFSKIVKKQAADSTPSTASPVTGTITSKPAANSTPFSAAA